MITSLYRHGNKCFFAYHKNEIGIVKVELSTSVRPAAKMKTTTTEACKVLWILEAILYKKALLKVKNLMLLETILGDPGAISDV